ncbi:MAG: hypothetical protein ACRDDZ_11745 [Marinifilaceae bacterium]
MTMIRTISNIAKLIIAVLCISTFLTCTDDVDVSLNYGEGTENDGGTPMGEVEFGGMEGSQIGFSGGFGFPGQSTPISSGEYVTVYIYKHRASTSRSPLAVRRYVSGPPGQLTEISTPVYLPPGYYDIYAVSSNSIPDKTPTFKGGKSVSIKKGVDYIWTSLKKVDVYTNPIVVPLLFEQICFKLNIDISDSFFTVLWKVESVSVTIPTGKQYIELATGDILPQTLSNSGTLALKLLGRNCWQIIPPFTAKKPITLNIVAYTNDHILFPKTFSVKIPTPRGGFLPGHQYNYKAIIDDDILSVEEQVHHTL